ncbi:MAG: PIN domain-containing protein [Gemmatimonas sp.]|nr:PIN domain-containing protein [Gemmatimonas sp.]
MRRRRDTPREARARSRAEGRGGTERGTTQPVASRRTETWCARSLSPGAGQLNAAYVDTSCLVAIAFGETGATALARRLQTFDLLLSANLLEAELLAAFAREGVPASAEFVATITWVLPDRPLSREIEQVLRAGYLRGADLWHLACAIHVASKSRDLAFLTRDRRQAEVARQLGFAS